MYTCTHRYPLTLNLWVCTCFGLVMDKHVNYLLPSINAYWIETKVVYCTPSVCAITKYMLTHDTQVSKQTTPTGEARFLLAYCKSQTFLCHKYVLWLLKVYFWQILTPYLCAGLFYVFSFVQALLSKNFLLTRKFSLRIYSNWWGRKESLP